MENRLLELVKALTNNSNDLIGDWYLGDQHIDCISIIDGEVVFCCWNDEFEYQIFAASIKDAYLLELIEELETLF